MMREMDAGEGSSAEVICAVGFARKVSSVIVLQGWQSGKEGERVEEGIYTALICLLIPG